MHTSVPASPEVNHDPAEGVCDTPGVKVMTSRLSPLVQTVSPCGPPEAPARDDHQRGTDDQHGTYHPNRAARIRSS